MLSLGAYWSVQMYVGWQKKQVKICQPILQKYTLLIKNIFLKICTYLKFVIYLLPNI